MNLTPECGVTEVSLANAAAIVDALGIPSNVQLFNDGTDTSTHVVTALWGESDSERKPFDHKFTGFTWGYDGEGPAGLVKFFHLIGLDAYIPSDVVFNLPPNRHGMLLSVSRTAWLIEYARFEGAERLSTAFSDAERRLKKSSEHSG